MSFKQELSQFVKTTDKPPQETEEPAGAVLLNPTDPPPPNENLYQEETLTSPPAKNNSMTEKNRTPALFLEGSSPVLLDDKSQEALERTKKELNIGNEQEALRILIQLGRKNLNRLLV